MAGVAGPACSWAVGYLLVTSLINQDDFAASTQAFNDAGNFVLMLAAVVMALAAAVTAAFRLGASGTTEWGLWANTAATVFCAGMAAQKYALLTCPKSSTDPTYGRIKRWSMWPVAVALAVLIYLLFRHYRAYRP
jgi:hypothetical protein